MTEIVQLACDLCGTVGATKVTARIGDGGWWEVDLCRKCLAPVQRVSEASRPTRPPARQRKKFEKTELPPQP